MQLDEMIALEFKMAMVLVDKFVDDMIHTLHVSRVQKGFDPLWLYLLACIIKCSGVPLHALDS